MTLLYLAAKAGSRQTTASGHRQTKLESQKRFHLYLHSKLRHGSRPQALVLPGATAEMSPAEGAADVQEGHQPNDQNATADNKSALHANIEAKGKNSYYFAHAPRNTGEAPAPPPVHQPLEVLKVDAPAEVYEVLASGYQFLDEGGKTVKVYLPLEGVGERCGGSSTSGGSVSVEFGERSLTACIRGYKEGRTLRFDVKALAGDLDVGACSYKVLANKVVITLAKAGDSPARWSSLTGK